MKLKIAIKDPLVSSETQTVIDNAEFGVQTKPIEQKPCSECLQRKKIQLESEAKVSQTMELAKEPVKAVVPAKMEDTKEKLAVFNPDTSLFLLIQKERQKYNQLILKTTEEKKRKQVQWTQALAQITLMKNVLKFAGLEFDQTEFQKIVQEKSAVPSTPIMILSSSELNPKAPLAPIQKMNCIHEMETEAIQELLNKEENHRAASSAVNDSISEYTKINHLSPQESIRESEDKFNNDYMSEITAIEPKEARIHKNPRTEKLILKHNDTVSAFQVHNQNLDYNNRAKYYLDNLFYETKEEQVEILETLPPLADKTIDAKQKSKTSYAEKIWRAKRIKEKQHQDLLDKI
jgi:hypothetical protein